MLRIYQYIDVHGVGHRIIALIICRLFRNMLVFLVIEVKYSFARFVLEQRHYGKYNMLTHRGDAHGIDHDNNYFL